MSGSIRKLRDKKNKEAIVSSEIAGWVIALLVLAFFIIFIIATQKEGLNLLEKLKDILRFRR